jgi:hypothetical protein
VVEHFVTQNGEQVVFVDDGLAGDVAAARSVSDVAATSDGAS